MEWELIAKILAGALGLLAQSVKEKGSDALKAELEHLRPIIDAIYTGDLGRLDPGDAQDALDKLKLALLEHDAEADAELRRRFPTGSNGQDR